MNHALLVLEDGTVFRGRSFGATGECCGEAVFNTSMTGYQEILTDPSYKGQIVAMTYPLIGNYGTNQEDIESHRPYAEGFVVHEYSRVASNWRNNDDLGNYLKKYGVVGIEGVDTRYLTLHLREQGAMKAGISTDDNDPRSLLKKVRASRGLVGRNLVKEVVHSRRTTWEAEGKKSFEVVVIDCGVKFNIIRNLQKRQCLVHVVPAGISAGEIIAMKPDGVVLSNGPGDPAAVTGVIETTRGLLGKLPIFGICLGHQMLGLALGGTTYKLKFGHHGANQPVKDLKTGKVAITAQNHGFCVDMESLRDADIIMTHLNLNDKTLEGMRHKKFPAFSVQFHPEASPGPHDAEYLFDEFVVLMQKEKVKRRAKTH